jgi:AraC-like DNA-binding protein
MTIIHEKNHWLRQPYMPVSYATIYLDLAAERGMSTTQVLQQAGLHAHLLTDLTGRISPQQYVHLVAAVLALTGDNGLGFEVGARQPLTAHGSLGYALLCCSHVDEAVSLLQRFWHIRGRGIRLACYQQSSDLVFEFYSDMPISEAVRRVLFDAMLSGFYHSLRFILSESELLGELWFDYAQPDYVARFSQHLPTLCYQMPTTQLRVPIALSKKRLVMANPEALALAVAQCERESSLLAEQDSDILISARAAMVLTEHGYLHPDKLAERLHVSTRTLRRHLQMQGVSYQALLEEARRRDALVLLEKPNIEIQKIAELLGYNNPANFTRAFKEWTGRTPSQFRAIRAI